MAEPLTRKEPRMTSARIFLIVCLILGISLVIADGWSGKALSSARKRAVSAGLRLEEPNRLSKDDPRNAASIYLDLAASMEAMPHNFKYTDKNWPSSEPDLAVQKRIWMKPYLARIKEANARPRLEFEWNRAGKGQVGSLVLGATTEANWLLSEGKIDAAVEVLEDAITFSMRTPDDPDLDDLMLSENSQFGLANQLFEIVQRNQGNKVLLQSIVRKMPPIPSFSGKDFLRHRPLEIAEIVANPGTTRYKGINAVDASAESIGLMAMPSMKQLVEAKMLDNAVELYKLLPDDMANWASVSKKYKIVEDRQFADKSKIGSLAAELTLPIHSLIENSAYTLSDLIFNRIAVLVAAGAPPKVMPIDPWNGRPFVLRRTAGGYDLVSPGRRSKSIKITQP